MYPQIEQARAGLWHDVQRHRIEVAKQLVKRYQLDRSPEKRRLVCSLKRDIAKTRKALAD